MTEPAACGSKRPSYSSNDGPLASFRPAAGISSPQIFPMARLTCGCSTEPSRVMRKTAYVAAGISIVLKPGGGTQSASTPTPAMYWKLPSLGAACEITP